MNRNLLIPRRTRSNPNWLVRTCRWVGQMRRQIALYWFYRGLNHAHRESWDKALRTLR